MTSNSSVGFLSLADGTFAGDHVQPSSVARDFLSPLCLLNRWERFFQCPPNVRSDVPVRDGFRLPASTIAHRRHPFSMLLVIAPSRYLVTANIPEN